MATVASLTMVGCINLHQDESVSGGHDANVITLASCEDGNCPGIDQWTDTQDFRVQG